MSPRGLACAILVAAGLALGDEAACAAAEAANATALWCVRGAGGAAVAVERGGDCADGVYCPERACPVPLSCPAAVLRLPTINNEAAAAEAANATALWCVRGAGGAAVAVERGGDCADGVYCPERACPVPLSCPAALLRLPTINKYTQEPKDLSILTRGTQKL
ncbi:hypothetical protein DIPPA_10946 [Diplonema papillatum]|nr:hypothetical protein DIPPA_10946 [Diplonema papillatum]